MVSELLCNLDRNMQDSSSSLSCNSCHTNVDGIAYRTSCMHLLCPACAKHFFADGRTCTICSTVLSKGKVKEAVIGVSAQVELSDSLFQLAFSSANLTSIVENLDNMRLAFAELENFVSTQLLFEASQQQASAIKALMENESLNDQLGSASHAIRANEESMVQNQMETENILKSRDVEMSELKDAYKEKHRKCQAWEKAYNSIRDQVGGPSTCDNIANEQPQHNQQRLSVPPQRNYAAPQQIAHQYKRDSPQDAHPPGYNPRPPAGAGQRPPQPFQPSPPIRRNGARATLRTEVTSHSKTFVPVGQYNEHRYQQAPPAQHQSPHSVVDYGQHSVVSGRSPWQPSPEMPSRHYPSFNTSPVEQQIIPVNQNNGYGSSAGYQRAGLKKRHLSPSQNRVKSSFFD